MPSVSGRALNTVYLIMLMDTLNFGIVFPLVPSIAKEFGANATMVGSMATVYSFCQFAMAPILGRLSDGFGRRPILLVAVLGTTLSSLGTGWAWDFTWVLVARCINGASGGTVGVVQAYIADVTNAEERKIYMSYISAVNAIGLVVGPAVGGACSKWGFTQACYVSAGLSAVNFLAAMIFLPESRWQQEGSLPLTADDGREGASDGQQGAQQAEVDASPQRLPWKAGLLFGAAFLNILGLAAMESIMSYYLMDTFFDGDEKQTGTFYGLCFMFVGVAMFIVSFFLYKPLVKHLGQVPLVVIGALTRSAGFMLQPMALNKMQFAGALMVVVTGGQLVIPTATTLLTTMCPKNIYGTALSYQQSCQTLARIIGPLVFGHFYDKVDHRFSFRVCAAASLLAGVLILPVARPRRRAPPRPESEGPETGPAEARSPGLSAPSPGDCPGDNEGKVP